MPKRARSRRTSKGRIFELEELLKNVELITKHSGGSLVDVGSTIVVKKGDKTATYNIVGSYEANPLEGKISDESPLGKAFLGEKNWRHRKRHNSRRNREV